MSAYVANRGTSQSVSFGTTLSLTPSGAMGAGNKGILFIGYLESYVSVTGVSGGGVTWTERSDTSGNGGLAIYEASGACSTAGITITLGTASSAGVCCSLEEFSGMGTYDKGATHTGGFGADWDSGTTGTSAQANQMAVAACTNQDDTAFNANPTGYTPMTQVVITGNMAMKCWYKVRSSVGTEIAQTTGSGGFVGGAGHSYEAAVQLFNDSTGLTKTGLGIVGP